jgi:hypothetical protein
VQLKRGLFNLHYQLERSYLCSLYGRNQYNNQLGLILHYGEECDHFLRVWCLQEHLLHRDHEVHYSQLGNNLQCVHLYLLSPNNFSDLFQDKKVFLVPMGLRHLLKVLVPSFQLKRDPNNLRYQLERSYLCSLYGRNQYNNLLGSILHYEEGCDHFLRVWCLQEHQLQLDREVHYNQLGYNLQFFHLCLLSPSSSFVLSLDRKVFFFQLVLLNHLKVKVVFQLKLGSYNLHYQLERSYLCSLCGRNQYNNLLGSILHYEEECDHFLRAWCLQEHQLQ